MDPNRREILFSDFGGVTLVFPPFATHAESDDENAQTVTIPIEDTTPPVEMRVSARLMAAASRYFATLLAGSFRDGSDLNTHGDIRIHMPDDNPYLWIVLLNIIHGWDDEVPRYLAMDELLEIAGPVNKYQLGNAIKHHSDIWMDNSMRDIPGFYADMYVQELLQWVGLGWQFRHDRSFSKASLVLVNWATGPLDSRILEEEISLIPKWMFEKLQLSRIKTLKDIFREVNTVYQNARLPLLIVHHWGFDIDGSIGREWRDSFLADCTDANIRPIPPSPYIGHSVSGLLNELEKLQIDSFSDHVLGVRMLHVSEWPHGERANTFYRDCLECSLQYEGDEADPSHEE